MKAEEGRRYKWWLDSVQSIAVIVTCGILIYVGLRGFANLELFRRGIHCPVALFPLMEP